MNQKNNTANVSLILGIAVFIDCYVWWVMCYSAYKDWKYIDTFMILLTCSIFILYTLSLIFGIIGLINYKKQGGHKKDIIKSIIGILSVPMFFLSQEILYLSGLRESLLELVSHIFE